MRLLSKSPFRLESPRRLCAASLVALATLLSGCAGYQAFQEGQAQLQQGQTLAGLAKLREAQDQAPGNIAYRQAYFSSRERVANGLVDEAEAALTRGDFVQAHAAYTRLRDLDPGDARANLGLDRAAKVERQWRLLEAAMSQANQKDLDGAVDKTQQVLSEDPTHRRAKAQLRQLLRAQAEASGRELGVHPKLKAAYRAPVTISFQGASLQQVLESLKLASGLNFVVEQEVRPDIRVTLSVTRKPLEDVLRLILATNQLERRVLDEDTVLIFPNTAAKLAEYRELVVRTFYLSHAEASKVAAHLKTVVRVRDVVVDEKLNLVVVRDSAEAIRLSEKLIAALDIAEPEVMLDLEVLEVNVSRLLDLGVRWPDSFSAAVVGSAGVPGQLTLPELRNRNEGMIRLNTNSTLVAAQLRSQVGDSSLLANPRVRVRNKQSAKVLIGQKVPVITTTTTANVGSSQSVTYLDVGLKLEIEPVVSLDDEVSMKVLLEVSNIAQTIGLAGGSQAYVLGTRTTSTVLRVRDGETNILAGLIQRDMKQSNSGVPGLNQLPLLSRLFGVGTSDDTRTEIVLLITPRIVKALEVPGIGQQEFLSGTESATGALPIQLGTPRPPSATAPTPQGPPPMPPPGLPQPGS